MGETNDFYEDDEPLEKVLRAFNAGEKGLTTRPSLGQTATLSLEMYRGPRGWTETLQLNGLISLAKNMTRSFGTAGPLPSSR